MSTCSRVGGSLEVAIAADEFIVAGATTKYYTLTELYLSTLEAVYQPTFEGHDTGTERS
jgi:hypothetical protein